MPRTWSSTPPTEPGLYWVAHGDYVADEPVRFMDDNGTIRSSNKRRDKIWDAWMGPIEKPAIVMADTDEVHVLTKLEVKIPEVPQPFGCFLNLHNWTAWSEPDEGVQKRKCLLCNIVDRLPVE